MHRLVVLFLFLNLLAGCGSSKKDVEDVTKDAASTADTAAVEQIPPELPTDVPVPFVVDPPTTTPQVATPESLPAPEIAEKDFSATPDVASPLLTSTTDTYTVRRGDTLMKIAFELYGDIDRWKYLFEHNRDKLKFASRLEVGTVLSYEKPAQQISVEKQDHRHKIRQGDTLGSIAEELYAKRSKWKKLWEYNRQLIKDPNRIYAGFYLYYQITEQERLAAEKRKQSLGTASPEPQNIPAVTQPPKAATQPSEQPQQQTEETGLNSLINTDRSPASAK